jgi:hypothetical protein
MGRKKYATFWVEGCLERKHWGNVTVDGRLTFRVASQKVIGPV